MLLRTKITIRDEQGVGEALMKEGYSKASIDLAKQIIKRQFEKTARRVFFNMLEVWMPAFIVIDLETSPNPCYSAAFCPTKSDKLSFCFVVYKSLVKTVLMKGKHEVFKQSVIHEMIHAVDNCHWIQYKEPVETVQSSLSEEGVDGCPMEVLDDIRSVFEHFRREGVALLGEDLLVKRKFKRVDDPMAIFRRFYERFWSKSIHRIQGDSVESVFDESNAFFEAYLVGPTVMLLVLKNRGDVAEELAQKTLEGFNTGVYNLTDKEVKSILEAALALNLKDYMRGFVQLGEKEVPRTQKILLLSVKGLM